MTFLSVAGGKIPDVPELRFVGLLTGRPPHPGERFIPRVWIARPGLAESRAGRLVGPVDKSVDDGLSVARGTLICTSQVQMTV